MAGKRGSLSCIQDAAVARTFQHLKKLFTNELFKRFESTEWDYLFIYLLYRLAQAKLNI